MRLMILFAFPVCFMLRFSLRTLCTLLLIVLWIAGCGGASRETVVVTERPETIPSTEEDAVRDAQTAVRLPRMADTVQARRFDQGKMWTFDAPPLSYFQEEYGFRPSNAWLSQARLGALRFGGGCSASFVSPNGLVLTNHHCARDAITEVSQEDEDLLSNGFYANTLEEERKTPSLHVDQLVQTKDVTQRVYSGLSEGGDARAEARRRRVDQLEETLDQEAKRKNETLRVEIVSLYSGARYSAYTYRRYEDVRLVMAPALEVGFFGGAADNFTYPRFVLDVAFFRVYNDGKPLANSDYFPWSTDGIAEGQPVFVVGNPGSTSRLTTVGQLTYKRDYELPNQLDALRARQSILQAYVEQHPDSADAYGLRNTFFSVANTVKSLDGQLRGLRDPYLIARRGAAEQALLDSIQVVDSLRNRYGSVVREIQQLQQSKRVIADKNGAFVAFSSTQLGSRILSRAIYGYFYDFLRTRGAAADRVESIRADAMEIRNWPPPVEEAFIVERLRELRDAYGPQHPSVQRVLGDQSPRDVARRLVQESALMDSTGFVTLLDEGYLRSKDPSVPIVKAIAPLFRNANRQMTDFNDSEENLNAQLARARFAAYGTSVPPDASFSLRLSDGRVQSYTYNGTQAPAFTNFYGLYDHYYSYGQPAWNLPDRWKTPPRAFDLDTPLNLVSTNDISGGSSGSPLLNRDLEVVGVIFDSNIEALPNEFLYTNQTARAISVDARGIVEALRDMIGAERLVTELTTGNLAASDGSESSPPAASQ